MLTCIGRTPGLQKALAQVQLGGEDPEVGRSTCLGECFPSPQRVGLQSGRPLGVTADARKLADAVQEKGLVIAGVLQHRPRQAKAGSGVLRPRQSRQELAV